MYHIGKDRQGGGGDGVVVPGRSLAVQSSTVKLATGSSHLDEDQSRKEQTERLWLRSVLDQLSVGRWWMWLTSSYWQKSPAGRPSFWEEISTIFWVGRIIQVIREVHRLHSDTVFESKQAATWLPAQRGENGRWFYHEWQVWLQWLSSVFRGKSWR